MIVDTNNRTNKILCCWELSVRVPFITPSSSL